MDWQQSLAQLVAPLGQLGPGQWLTIAAANALLALLMLVIVQARRRAGMRGRRAGMVGGSVSQTEENAEPGAALEGISLSPIDRVFPRRPVRFLLLVGTIAIGCWLAGFLLAPNVSKFLTSPEWLFQPIYIAAHLVTLRLFINVFTRSYAAGVSHLMVSRSQALRGVRTILGLHGALVAAAIALPFCWFDFHYLFSDRYTRMGGDAVVRPIDYLMWAIWSLEWFINALIWVLLLGFMVKNCATIIKHPFRSPIHQVLQEKHYRPFLQMSAQGASVLLGFSCLTVLYIVYTGGELTDYLGLGITLGLLVLGFVPPWLLLRAKVDTAVKTATARLQQGTGLGGATGALGLAATERPIEHRLDEALALLRIWHLQHLYGNLGQTEARAILIRLLAPAATIGWQVAHNYGDMAKKLASMVGTMGVK